MSQKKSGKGKGKYFEDFASQRHRAQAAAIAAPEEPDIPGAMKKGTLIMAMERNGETFHIAKIVDVRIAQTSGSSEFQEPLPKRNALQQPVELEEIVNEDAEMKDETKKLDQAFEYYINYLGKQRRNDRWIIEKELRITEDEIAEEFKKYEEA